jgi:hypothetical protein
MAIGKPNLRQAAMNRKDCSNMMSFYWPEMGGANKTINTMALGKFDLQFVA